MDEEKKKIESEEPLAEEVEREKAETEKKESQESGPISEYLKSLQERFLMIVNPIPADISVENPGTSRAFGRLRKSIPLPLSMIAICILEEASSDVLYIWVWHEPPCLTPFVIASPIAMIASLFAAISGQ